MEATEKFIVREYIEEFDILLLQEWERARSARPDAASCLRIGGLPPVGLILECEGEGDSFEPLAAVFLHFSVGVGVALLEHLLTAPGFTVDRMARGLPFLVGCAEAVAKKQGCGLILSFLESAALSKGLTGCGWVNQGKRFQLAKSL